MTSTDNQGMVAYNSEIKDLILTVRGVQVLLDSDVAHLYGYETKRINETANRNKKRFPENFRFQLTKEEANDLVRSQIATLKSTSDNHLKYRPYVYSEQGIAMLSGLLKSDVAIQVSISIMEAFVEMRRFLYVNKSVFDNIAGINAKLIEHDERLLGQSEQIDKLFGMLDSPTTNQQWIFYRGQFYDAFNLVIEIIGQAKKSIVVIDNYLDDSILKILTSKQDGVAVTLITSSPGKLSQLHLDKFTSQYGEISIAVSKAFHDRFIVLDDKEVYAFGASIKDLGNKCFEVSKYEDGARFVSYVNNAVNSK